MSEIVHVGMANSAVPRKKYQPLGSVPVWGLCYMTAQLKSAGWPM